MQQRFEIGFFLLLLGGGLLLSYFVLAPYLPTLFLALIFAITLDPLRRKLLVKLRHQRTLAALCTITLACIIIILPLLLFGFFAFRDAQNLYQTVLQSNGGELANLFPSLEHRLQEVWPGSSLDILGYTKQALNFTLQNLGGIFLSFVNITVNLLILIISLFFFLRDGEEFRKRIVATSPLANRYDEAILNRLAEAVNAVVRGKLAVALLQGILVGLGFLIFNIPSPMLWGAAAAVAALIPPFGTALITVPAAIFLFFSQETYAAIGILIWGIFLVGLIDNIVGPILVERRLRIHPLFVLLGVLGGLVFFGPIGFFAGPVTLALLLSLLELYPLIIEA